MWRFLKNLEIELPYDPSIPLLGIYPEETKVGKDPHIPLFIAAAAAAAAKSLQSCPTLCDPIDGRPPGSAVPGLLQAGTREWVAISFSKA